MRDTMSPSSLNQVVDPQVYSSTQNMTALWRERARLTQGRPFEVEQDIFRAATDVILAASFGFEIGAIKSQAKLLSGINKLDLHVKVVVASTYPAGPAPTTT